MSHITEQNLEIEDLIVQLTHLLQNWEAGDIEAMITKAEELENPYPDDLQIILATRVNVANTVDQDQFACFTQLDVEKPETYACTMQGPNAAKWIKAMEEELDQLEINNT